VQLPHEPIAFALPRVEGERRVQVASQEAPARAPALQSVPRGPVATVDDGDWVVQLGAFHDRANVNDLVRRLHAAGISAALRDGKTLTFVQVGPFASRNDALQQSVRIASAGFDSVVVRNPDK
jgi:cell division septation protein DedD